MLFFFRFQQILHSIFTARIMINLREVVRRERSLRQGGSASSKGSTGYLSSVILGVETWFQPHDDPQELGRSISMT